MTTTQQFRVSDLRFEHYTAAHRFGIGETRPRLSWKVAGAPDGFKQARYQLQIYTQDPASANATPYDQTVESDQSVLVPWPENLASLDSRSRAWARVRCWNQKGVVTEWGALASVETGLLEPSLWVARRICSPWPYDCTAPQPVEHFVKRFAAPSGAATVVKARLYITSQGVYEAAINGRRVGDYFMAPGWTVYDKRIRYQTYDVMPLLHSQQNILTVRLAEGWFCGRLGWGDGFRGLWGDRPSVLAQLELTLADGSMEIISTNESWQVAKGPTLKAEIYDGEKYDARLELTDLAESTKGARWTAVSVLESMPSSISLVPDTTEPVRRITTLQPTKTLTTPSGGLILDFGQNVVGYTRIKRVVGLSGDVVRLSHAEVLEEEELGRRPLRAADNVDQYTLKGASEGESWEPSFTFHGFRYVQVDGWPCELGQDQTPASCIEAVICHNDMRRIGQFTCSDPLLNRLHENVVWSMRGNFLSVPTDCPQRDERLGWTGDLAVFAPTACRLYDATNMLADWLKDVELEQRKHDGVPTMVVPNVLERDPIFGHVRPAAIWSDVTVLAPWTLFRATGDLHILQQQYASMTAWIERIPRGAGSDHNQLWGRELPQLGVCFISSFFTVLLPTCNQQY